MISEEELIETHSKDMCNFMKQNIGNAPKRKISKSSLLQMIADISKPRPPK